MAGPKLAPRRYCASPTNPHNMVRPPPWPAAAKESQLTPSIKMLAMSKAVVAGASFSPNKRESFLLKRSEERRVGKECREGMGRGMDRRKGKGRVRTRDREL